MRFLLVTFQIAGVTLFLAAFTSGIREKHKYNQVDIPEPQHYTKNPNDQAVRDNQISHAAYLISIQATVDGSAVGMDGRETAQYRRYKWLSEFATNKELINLTKHKSVNVKAYAFSALVNRDAPECKTILEQNLNDNTSFNRYGGCIIDRCYVNVFFLSCLSRRLSPADIASYKKTISRHFDKNTWEHLMLMNGI